MGFGRNEVVKKFTQFDDRGSRWNKGFFQPPSGNDEQFDIQNGPGEIVSFPNKKMVVFHSYVNVY